MKRRTKIFNVCGPLALASLASLLIILAACSHSSSPKEPNLIPVSVSFGEVGRSPGQFSYPRCIDAGLGALWVVDKTARIQKLDPKTGAYLGGWRMPEFEFGKPTGITVAPGAGGEMLVYVADTHYHRVRIYRPGDSYEGKRDPELLATIGSYGKGDGQLIFPTDIAVLMSADNTAVERLYISEYGGNDRVNIYIPAPLAPGQDLNSYVFFSSFGTFGSSATPDHLELSRPQSLAVDAISRQLIVADACNHRLGVFTLDGSLIRWIGAADEPSDAPGRFKFPYGLQLLPDHTALVAEFGGNRIQRIDLNTGQSLGIYGSAGRGKGHLASPWGVTILGDTVYALDSGNNRVLGFPARFEPPPKPAASSSNNTPRSNNGSNNSSTSNTKEGYGG